MQMKTANYIILPPLFAVTFFVFYFLSSNPHIAAFKEQRLIISFILLLFNLAVLTYHWLIPPPPKFTLNKTRSIVLFIHLVAGTVELVACILAYMLQSPEIAIFAAIVALLFHLPTALFMTPDVFGAKGLMIPSYIFIILMNGCFAVRVLIEPSNFEWVLSLFIALNTYVLVRVFYYLFEKAGMFPNSRYSAAIIISGFIVGPAVLGPVVSLYYLAYHFVDLFLFQKFMQFDKRQIADLYIEHHVTDIQQGIIRPMLDKNFVSMVIKQHPNFDLEKSYTDKELAKLFFEYVDQDRSGYLDFHEWQLISNHWRIRSDLEREFFKNISVNGRLDFSSFYEHVWLMGSNLRIPPSTQVIDKLSDKEFARVVFDQLDLYGKGKLGMLELELLLAEWGLRPPETSLFASKYAMGMGFEEFYKNFPMIWKKYR